MFEVQLQVEDAAERTASARLSVLIRTAPPALRFGPTSNIPVGEVGQPYAARFTATGGSSGGYRWAVSMGVVPNGLTLTQTSTSQATLSGTPTAAGTYPLTLELRDPEDRLFSARIIIEIEPSLPPLRIVPTTTGSVGIDLPASTLNLPYRFALEARGGSGPFVWDLEAGRLPPGLSLQLGSPRTIQIEGVPTEVGTFTATLAVSGPRGSDRRGLRLAVAWPALTIPTASVADVAVCRPYEAEITAAGGTSVNYRWQLSSGALPPGVRLEPSGPAGARLVGTVLKGNEGVYPLMIRVQDSALNTATLAFNLRVVDGGDGQRWVAMTGRVYSNPLDQEDALLVDICAPSPTPAIAASPAMGPPHVRATSISVSPDGRNLAFIADPEVPAGEDVHVFHMAGGGPAGPERVRNSSHSPASNVSFFAWAPDGQNLVFWGLPRPGVGPEWIFAAKMGAGATPSRTLALLPTPTGPVSLDAKVGFSPDGRWVVFETGRFASARLWLYDLHGGSVGSARPVAPGLQAGRQGLPTWSPTSDRFLFTSNHRLGGEQYDLYLAEVSSSTLAVRRVSHNFNVGSVFPTSSSFPPTYAFTEDGQRAFYVANEAAPGTATLYATELSSSGQGQAVFSAPNPSRWSPHPLATTGARVVVVGDLLSNGNRQAALLDLAQTYPIALSTQIVSGTVEMQGVGRVGVSPNGRWLAFAGTSGPGGNGGFLVDLNNPAPEPTQLTSPVADSSMQVTSLHWAPTSTALLVRGNLRQAGLFETYIVDISAGSPFTASAFGYPLGGPSSSFRDIAPVWRLDGGAAVQLSLGPGSAPAASIPHPAHLSDDGPAHRPTGRHHPVPRRSVD